MEKDVSQMKSSLALVEIEEPINETELKVYVNPRLLSGSNMPLKEQSAGLVVKIKGNITVSF